MAGAGKRKCKICDRWIDDNSKSLKYKTGYAHIECFNIAIKVANTEKKEGLQSKKKTKTPIAKPQKELKDGLSEEEYSDKKQLCDYIRSLIKEDLSVKIYKLMDDYKKKYKISYKQIYEDLYWYFDITDHTIDGDVIGIVPYCHTEAQKYYESIARAQTSCQEHLNGLSEMYKEVVAVAPAVKQPIKPQIDLATLGKDD